MKLEINSSPVLAKKRKLVKKIAKNFRPWKKRQKAIESDKQRIR